MLEQLGNEVRGWHPCLEEEASSEFPLARPDASATAAAQVCPHLPSHILAHGLHPTSFFLSLLEKYFINMPFNMSLGSKNCQRYVPPSLFLQVWWNLWHQWDQDHCLLPSQSKSDAHHFLPPLCFKEPTRVFKSLDVSTFEGKWETGLKFKKKKWNPHTWKNACGSHSQNPRGDEEKNFCLMFFPSSKAQLPPSQSVSVKKYNK